MRPMGGRICAPKWGCPVVLRHTLHRVYAKVVNEKRHYPEYSWGWLNQFVERLFWENPGACIRPQYAWGAVFAAALARALGNGGVALIEFGVAGGRGLLALRDVAEDVSSRFGLRLCVYGFDTGCGLPDITDPRDLPQLWKAGDYPMKGDALKDLLRSGAKILIGDVKETLDTFLSEPHSPVGFASFDMDFYNSTKSALKLFRGSVPLEHCLPRVVCYMDDIMGVSFGDVSGERLAMKEYNQEESPMRCISPVYGLRYHLGWPHNRAQWPDMLFWAHFLDHPQYGVHDGLVAAANAPLG